MHKYAINCTEEQTKKAIKLGAPIERGHDSSRYFNTGVPTFFDKNDEICRVRNSVIFNPTAEQMIGWLEEQDDINFITVSNMNYDLKRWYFEIYPSDRTAFLCNLYCRSRKEATLAAIDAALDFLLNKE